MFVNPGSCLGCCPMLCFPDFVILLALVRMEDIMSNLKVVDDLMFCTWKNSVTQFIVLYICQWPSICHFSGLYFILHFRIVYLTVIFLCNQATIDWHQNHWILLGCQQHLSQTQISSVVCVPSQLLWCSVTTGWKCLLLRVHEEKRGKKSIPAVMSLCVPGLEVSPWTQPATYSNMSHFTLT